MRYIFTYDNCPYCDRAVAATVIHNVNSDPEKWIEMIDIDSGDPRIKKLKHMYKVALGEIEERHTYYLPTAFLNNTVINSCRGFLHYLCFTLGEKCRR